MSKAREVRPDEVEHLLRNAQLRDALDPYLDEAYVSINAHRLPTPVENQWLENMLAWERAPIVPIAQWFDPPLLIPAPEAIDDSQLHDILWDTIQHLFDRRIVLDFTDHLSDRQLYTIIYRDILPSPEKQFERGDTNYLHWDCADTAENPEVWLRYYASEEDRRQWVETEDAPLPAPEPPPYPRNLPRCPL